jgi:prepilin-type processing-associated H-X9-DG protein
LEFGAKPTVGCSGVPEPVATPFFGSSCVLDDGGGSNMRFADGSVRPDAAASRSTAGPSVFAIFGAQATVK